MEELFVIKRDGRKENISFDKVLKRIQNLCRDPHLPLLKIDGTIV
jgi:transcriptional regulator NrdR family protein